MSNVSKSDDVLEMAVLRVRSGLELDFEHAFSVAQAILAAAPGYLGHQLRRCVEHGEQYLLLVQWRDLKDHTERFRKSVAYREWKQLLHRFYSPMPTVEHYAPVAL